MVKIFSDIKLYVKKWRIQLLFGIGIVVLLTLMEPNESENINQAEAFIKTNESVHQQVGPISKIDLKKWWDFDQSGSNPPWKKYLFYVKGEGKSALITIRANPSSSDEKNLQFLLVSVEIL